MWCGIDNGVTGSIGFVNGIEGHLFKTPVFKDRYYTKKDKFATRINFDKLCELIQRFSPTLVAIERPMINPSRFQASISAARAMEATIIALDSLKIKYIFVDSKDWQKILPEGDTKEQSLAYAKKVYPNIDYAKFKDADGLLIADYVQTLQNQ